MKTFEIERKFLIDKDKFFEYLSGCSKRERDSLQLLQCYIHRDEISETRVRFVMHKGKIYNGYIIVKYSTNNPSVRREFISTMDEQTREDYYTYIKEHNIRCIEKDRYGIIYSGHFFEIDFFKGDNEGLCLAEVELFREGEEIELPDFIIKEVTDDPKYYNKNLYINPYKNWRDNNG